VLRERGGMLRATVQRLPSYEHAMLHTLLLHLRRCALHNENRTRTPTETNIPGAMGWS
jgi:hypothetical protein